MMLPPPGFCKPLWRGWEGAGSVRTDLAVAVAKIKHSIGGCHREEVRREETHCPSSNQHHYVRQQPHRSEVIPQTTRKPESKGNVYYDNMTFNFIVVIIYYTRVSQV